LKKSDKYEAIVELARRKGFFWQSYEIYGGLSGFIDLGPLGVALKNNIISKWRDFFLKTHEFIEISTPVITPSKIFEASGHIEHFKDPIIECNNCKRKFRADNILKESGTSNTESLSLEELDTEIKKMEIKCPECKGELSKPDYFQTMFSTTIGPYSDSIGYGRPETAQGIFINFKRIMETMRGKFPLAIAQIGPALRNEISPRQGPIRLREFTIMEFEFFYDPENPNCEKIGEVENDSINILPEEIKLEENKAINMTIEESLDKGYILNEWLAYFMALSQRFVSRLGIPPKKQRFDEKLVNERAHYSTQTYDHEVLLERWGWIEVAGHALRTDYDLTRHMEKSGVDLRAYIQFKNSIVKTKKIIKPNVLKIKSKFENAEKALNILRKVDPNEVERIIKENGEYKIDKYIFDSGDLTFDFKEFKETGRRFVPHVVEPSYGLERLVYATLEYSYSRVDDRTVLKIPKEIAPVKAIVLPLVSKDDLPKKAFEIYDDLLGHGIDVLYDEIGSIGRRYARADEIGIPTAITIDYKTIEDNTVTLRDRDTWKQIRATSDKIIDFIERATIIK
jgi:glycyl-tRNA synthetase